MVATRATCDRKHVGAVIVQDKEIVSTGYNGSLSGQPHCDDPEIFQLCTGCRTKKKITEEQLKDYSFPTILRCTTSISCLGRKILVQHGGHLIEDGHCVRTVHAEINAITRCAKRGVPTKGATLYINTRPCWHCFKTAVSAGIVEIVYSDEYKSQGSDNVTTAAEEIPGFTLRRFEDNNG
jgi:dCMP deaminase